MKHHGARDPRHDPRRRAAAAVVRRLQRRAAAVHVVSSRRDVRSIAKEDLTGLRVDDALEAARRDAARGAKPRREDDTVRRDEELDL